LHLTPRVRLSVSCESQSPGFRSFHASQRDGPLESSASSAYILTHVETCGVPYRVVGGPQGAPTVGAAKPAIVLPAATVGDTTRLCTRRDSASPWIWPIRTGVLESPWTKALRQKAFGKMVKSYANSQRRQQSRKARHKSLNATPKFCAEHALVTLLRNPGPAQQVAEADPLVCVPDSAGGRSNVGSRCIGAPAGPAQAPCWL